MALPPKPAKNAQTIEGPSNFAHAFGVSRETMALFETYAGLLERWQPAVNLVASSTLDDVWSRHFADSAQLWRLGQGARSWLDLGAGAGFPGLVVALLSQDKSRDSDGLAPGAKLEKVTLIESDQRKCAFMRDVVRQTGLANVVDIVAERIETAANAGKGAGADVISARALAPMDRLLALAEPFFAEGTRGIFPKGRDVASELEAARVAWAFDAALVQSVTADDAWIVLIRGLGRKPEG